LHQPIKLDTRFDHTGGVPSFHIEPDASGRVAWVERKVPPSAQAVRRSPLGRLRDQSTGREPLHGGRYDGPVQ
jgi:hypothetical protein